MQLHQIVLALTGVALATPALAEKCSVCDFTDEPIVVKPAKQSSDAGAAPTTPSTAWVSVASALEERLKHAAPSVAEMVATKSTDLAGPSLMLSSSQGRSLDRGPGNDTLKSGFGNDVMQRGDRIGAAALPQPAGTGGGAGKVGYNGTQVFYLGGMPAPRTALTGAASSRPAESQSLNFTKIEYKYMPYDAKGPAVGAMTVRR
jgi:hypothetical protein